MTEYEMVGWNHQVDGKLWELVTDRCLVCYSPWDQKVLDTTERLNRIKLKNHKNAN